MKKFIKGLKDKLSKKKSGDQIEEDLPEEEWDMEEEIGDPDFSDNTGQFAAPEDLDDVLEEPFDDDEEEFTAETMTVEAPSHEEMPDLPPIDIDEESLELSGEISADLDEDIDLGGDEGLEDVTDEEFEEDEDMDFDEVQEFPKPMATPDSTGEVDIDPSLMMEESESTAEIEVGTHDETGQFSRMKVELPEPEGNLPRSPLSDKARTFLTNGKEKVGILFNSLVAGAKKRAADEDFNWDTVVAGVFSPESRAKAHSWFIGALLVSGTYTTGKAVALAINSLIKQPQIKLSSGPMSSPRASRTNIASISQKNLFNAKLTDQQTEDKQPVARVESSGPDRPCLKASRVSKLPITLISTMVLQDSVKSLASVSVKGSKDNIDFREGEKVSGMAKIGRIERLRVILKNLKSGECEYIESSEPKSAKMKAPVILSEKEGKKLLDADKPDGIKNEGNKYSIKKDFRDKMLEDISTVLTQAKANRIDNPDGSISFKMTNIVPGSIYSHLDIQEDDVISKINGKDITSLNEVMTMFGNIRDIDNLSITVKRNGVETDMEYSFE